MNYKNFYLDQFQTEAIRAIDQDRSVLVAAPTGAGKTVIAEFAIEKCLKSNRRAIYTAPIKALSNQKYRDLTNQYGTDLVGIVTGDVVINPFAQILLMTTEIFRNQIFEDSDRLSDVEYVIFDEIHYINDIERGTVWEESIIFAPQQIKFICLSATIPNIDQFAEWMRGVRDSEIDVIEERKRPVPLEHHLYINGCGFGDLKTLEQVQEFGIDPEIFGRKAIRQFIADEFPQIDQTDLIKQIDRKNRLPCLYFCFSRKRCEKNAETYAKRNNFLTKDQKIEMLEKFDQLCQKFGIIGTHNVNQFRKLIARGIAYHHAGMLPTLKEVVERLFTLGLIQLLFTTETFAVGINMPACTVIFEGLEKYDGISFRYLKSREYHQMAGRAGRRGIDTIGFVYARVNPRFADLGEVEKIVSGQLEPIESQFNLSYSSVLNLYDQYSEKIYDVCTQSLSNFQNLDKIQKINAQIRNAEKQHDHLPDPTCIHENVNPSQQIENYKRLLEWTDREFQRINSEKSTVRSTEQGRKRAKIRKKKFADLDRQRRQIDAKRKADLCNGCDHFKKCNRLFNRTKKSSASLKDLNRSRDFHANYQRNLINMRLSILRDLDYIDDSGLLPRGRIAAQINGYEMQVTELIFAGFFEDLSENEINILVSSIVCEPRKESFSHRKLRMENLQRMLENADQLLSRVRLSETKFGTVAWLPRLNPILCTAILAWSEGCEFEDLKNFADLADGDFVREFRLVIDLLRQIRQVVKNQSTISEKLNRCIDLLKRDVIDAERQLRIGREFDQQTENQT